VLLLRNQAAAARAIQAIAAARNADETVTIKAAVLDYVKITLHPLLENGVAVLGRLHDVIERELSGVLPDSRPARLGGRGALVEFDIFLLGAGEIARHGGQVLRSGREALPVEPLRGSIELQQTPEIIIEAAKPIANGGSGGSEGQGIEVSVDGLFFRLYGGKDGWFHRSGR